MKYQFKGNLRGFYCGDCYDFLYKANIKIYAVDRTANITAMAVAREKETFHQRSDEELKAISKRLIGEAVTDEAGNFSVELTEKNYDGGAFDIDFECGTVPLTIPPKKPEPPRPPKPFQFHVTTLQPMWKQATEETREQVSAFWEYAIPFKFWCWILRLFKIYVICGKVNDCKNKQPVGGVKVFAYDVDLIQDDYLGFGITDSNGNFRIYYTEADFSKTIFSWLNVEWPAGPDLYFKIEAGDGTVLLAENRQRGHDRDRANASNCFCVNFCVECPHGSMVCKLTGPAGCIDGKFKLTEGKYIPVTGSAGSCGLKKYELEVLWNGTLLIPGAIVYANASGNPDTALTFGNHAVYNGNVGFIDVQKVVEGAGANLATSTNFTVHLRCYNADGSFVDVYSSFQLDSSEVYIKNIGGRVAPDVLNAAEQLRIADSAVSPVGTIGGTVGIYGAARVYGCSDEQIKEYSLFFKHDDFASAQPPNGPLFNAVANGWTQICRVDYTNYLAFTPSELISNNELSGPTSRLTNSGFYTYPMPVWIPVLNTYIYIDVPKLAGSSWGTGTSGKYSVLLEVIDTAGTYYYDIQKVWVDNENIEGIITKIGSQPPCTDLYMRDKLGNFKTIDILGTAYDPLIIAGDLTQPTSDNFNQYQVNILKQSAAAANTIITSSNPVPARPALSGIGTLANFNLANLDVTQNPILNPGAAWNIDQLLTDGASCNYNFILYVSDKTLVSESDVHHISPYYFPIKIINSNEP